MPRKTKRKVSIAVDPTSRRSSHDRILESAKRLFAAKGYENTSTMAIARQAATSESQLMKHFGSKEGILQALFDSAWEQINRQIQGITREMPLPSHKLKVVADVVLSAVEKDQDLKVLLLLEGRRLRKGRMIILTKGFHEFVHIFDGVLEEMKAAGQLAPSFHPHAVRSALIGAFEGLLRDQFLGKRRGVPASYNFRALRQVFNRIVASFTRPKR